LGTEITPPPQATLHGVLRGSKRLDKATQHPLPSCSGGLGEDPSQSQIPRCFAVVPSIRPVKQFGELDAILDFLTGQHV